MAKIIKTTGETIYVQPKNGTDFQLAELQAIVEGYIEIVRLDDQGTEMVVNEEGKFTCAYNSVATAVAHLCRAIPINDYVCGNVLVCNNNQIK